MACRHIVMGWIASVACAGLTMMGPLLAGQAEPPFYDDKSKLLVYMDADDSQRPVRTPDDWQRRRAHILASMQLVMGPLPDDSRKVPLDTKVLEEATLPKTTRQRITYAAEEGDRVPAYLLIPRGLKGRAPAMLCLHPTSPAGKDVVAGLTDKPNRSYAIELAQRGYVTLAPDYLRMGENRTDAYALGYASATMKGIWNHLRAVDLLVSLPQVDAERIGCIGHSLGGHNAIFTAVFEPRITVLVSSCGFDSFLHYYDGAERNWYFGKGWCQIRYMPRLSNYRGELKAIPFDFPELLGALAPRPVFVNAPLRVAGGIQHAKPWQARRLGRLVHPTGVPGERRTQALRER